MPEPKCNWTRNGGGGVTAFCYRAVDEGKSYCPYHLRVIARQDARAAERSAAFKAAQTAAVNAVRNAEIKGWNECVEAALKIAKDKRRSFDGIEAGIRNLKKVT